MAAIGGLIGAAGSLVQGMAAQQEANYQAQIARNNAIIAKQNAVYAQVAGSREEEAYRIKATNVRATQRASFATSGIDVNIGSPLRIQVGTKKIEELDALTIRNNAFREATSFKQQARDFRAQAGLYEMQGRNAMISGAIGAASGALSAVGSVSGKWDSWRSPTPYTPVSYGPAAGTVPMTVPIVSSGSAQYGPMLFNNQPAFGAAGARS